MRDSQDRIPEADLIVDPIAGSGALNMAMDGALLELGESRNRTIVRIYRWAEPTVTVGYFQNPTAAGENPFPQLPAVRRLSGGGAILHDRELTYSCILPAVHPLRETPSELYRIVHRAIIGVFRACAVDCCLRNELPKEEITSQPLANEPWLCFLRADPNDIVHRSAVKIVGSAQRRRRGTILQHGSILLSASPVTPGLRGAKDLSPHFDSGRFEDLLPDAIAASVSMRWHRREFDASETSLAYGKLEQTSG